MRDSKGAKPPGISPVAAVEDFPYLDFGEIDLGRISFAEPVGESSRTRIFENLFIKFSGLSRVCREPLEVLREQFFSKGFKLCMGQWFRLWCKVKSSCRRGFYEVMVEGSVPCGLLLDRGLWSSQGLLKGPWWGAGKGLKGVCCGDGI